MNTKGFALILVLVVTTVISTSAILIYTMTRDEMAIAANNRRTLQSKLAAVSGITHFKSMELFYEHLRQQADVLGEEELIVINETSLGDRTFYKVEHDGRIISEHVKRSLFKTVD